ncbi:MAG: tryptophan--tRNA ligase [Clostridiales bacterium GWF2_38_85]|nr:MAG: tryptophan--tRNA ligase [Clostridiales bacterium GWF2_38_85]HBL84094.1 tryptophan--tRNA ligase [Clostridiales bacterium]
MLNDKKTIFSGIQPSGNLTIGNYLGSLKNWVTLQDEYNSLFCIVDLHAITVRQIPADLRKRTLEVLALYMACGLDPEKSIIFVQSHVPAHAELSWVLGCYTMFGELSRMTQFKDKSEKNSQNVNAGLFTYPVLMAADILLYQADLVPVGEDQKQHLEITRDIAERFNGVYGDTFTIPEPFIRKVGGKIMSISEPTKKMSKSDSGDGSVCILDDRDTIIRKFKRAVTDSDCEIKFSEGKDGINNLIMIYSAFSGKTTDEIEAEFMGNGYGNFKIAVGECCADALGKIKDKYNLYISDKAQLEAVMRTGSDKASYLARKTLSKVYRKVGFVTKP